jgi:adenine-specific DNA glycosylase
MKSTKCPFNYPDCERCALRASCKFVEAGTTPVPVPKPDPKVPESYQKMIGMTDAEQKEALGDRYEDWARFRDLPEEEKKDIWRGIDQMVEQMATETSRASKVQSLKGAKIQDVVVNESGEITKIVIVKDCIAQDLTWGKKTTVSLDGEVIGL